MTTEIWPGDRVVLFDNLLFENDIDTPLSVTMQPATVIRRYGYKSQVCGIYPDLIDVCFDHDGRESNGHFTSGAKATSTATQERQNGNG